MKIILLADGVVGLEVLKQIIKKFPQDLAVVFTVKENDIFNTAKQNKIPVKVFESDQSAVDEIAEKIDLGVMAWWPKIIKSPLIDLPKNGFINTHPSLLPHNRGKHYNFWALVEQSPFGVTIHRVDYGIDTGEIIAQQPISYDWTDNGGSLYLKAQNAIIKLFAQIYPSLRNETFASTPQNLSLGKFHHSSEINEASSIDLDKNYKASHLLNLLRARTFEGYPGCKFIDNGLEYEVTVSIKAVNKGT